MNNEPEYYYADNPENYAFDDLQECVEEIVGGAPGIEAGAEVTVWRGKTDRFTVKDLLPWEVDNICERLGEAAYERAGEASDGWPCLTNEQRLDLEILLTNTVNDWFKRNDLQPTFFGIEDPELLTIRLLQVHEAGSVKFEVIEKCPQKEP